MGAIASVCKAGRSGRIGFGRGRTKKEHLCLDHPTVWWSGTRLPREKTNPKRKDEKFLHPRRSPDLDDLSASSVSHRHSVLSQAPTLIRGRLNPARNIAYWLVVGLRHQASAPFESGEEHRKPAQRWMPSRAHLRRRSSSTKNIAIPLRVVQGEATFIRRLLALAVQLQYGVVCPRLKPWFISQGRKTLPVHLDFVRVRAIDQGSVREPLRDI